jgi:predicted ester cyclase
MGDAVNVVRRLEEAWAANDDDTVRQLWGSGYAEHAQHLGSQGDVESSIQANEGFRGAFPDAVRTIEDLFGQGDRVMVRVRLQATNEGGLPWFGIPANGNRVDIQWISEYRVADGRIVEHWAQMDLPTMMMQLGAMGGG